MTHYLLNVHLSGDPTTQIAVACLAILVIGLAVVAWSKP